MSKLSFNTIRNVYETMEPELKQLYDELPEEWKAKAKDTALRGTLMIVREASEPLIRKFFGFDGR